VLVVAFLLRAGIACWPVLSHPDELWQYMEPARHIVAGRWVETWDFRSGLRSWLLPMILSGPMALGYAIAPDARLDLLFARLFCALLSTLAVLACVHIGRRLSPAHGLIAGVATGCWFELVYFGPRTAAEPVATSLALLAAVLLLRRGTVSMLSAGLLIALGCAIRLQYLPALAILVIGSIGLNRRRYSLVLAGGLGGLAISGLADFTMGAVPFQWVWRSYFVNVTQGKAASFGVEPYWWYGKEAWNLYGAAIFAILPLVVVGGRRYPWLFASAMVNLAFHSCIAHQEYRFIFYTVFLFILLAAIGSVDLWSRYVRQSPSIPRRLASLPVLGSSWLMLSALSAGLGSAPARWGVNGRMIAAWKTAGDVADVCGVAVYRIADMPAASYAVLSRDVPIYQFDDADRNAGIQSRAFNVALTEKRFASDLKGFELLSCDRLNYFCVFRRPRNCEKTPTDSRYDENLFLIRKGS
ncbi:MAG: hypothetical protein M3N02_08610, partial [Pseudomonadota bacterium]|nr:hypothetical protein [Pseudomonadota bacterium]